MSKQYVNMVCLIQGEKVKGKTEKCDNFTSYLIKKVNKKKVKYVCKIS